MRRSRILSLSAILVIALTMYAVGGAESKTDQNKARVRQFYEEVFNAGKLDQADQFFTADAIDHEVMPGQKDPMPALANFKAFHTEFHKAFPDMQAKIEDMVAEGDKLVARLRLTGTHKREFNGMPATGKTISVEFIDIIRLTDGKLAEHWGILDDAALMHQLGSK